MEESERQIRIKLNERLVSSGAYATISQHLEKRLDETKWNEEIDKLAKDRIKDQIRQGGSIDRKQIADALMPIAMGTVTNNIVSE